MKRTIFYAVMVLAVFLLAACSRQAGKPSEGVDIVIAPEGEEAQPAEPAGALAEDTEMGDQKDTSALPEIKCDEKQTFGFIKCEPGEENRAELTIRNTGRADLDGAFFKFFDEGDIQVDQYSEMFSLPVGEDKVLELPLNNPRLWKIEVFPITEGNICGNKQLVVIPSTNCR